MRCLLKFLQHFIQSSKNFMKLLLTVFIAALLFSSCASLHSTTYIKPQESFVLGNNQHNSFSVNMENISKQQLEVYQAPVGGGRHSAKNIKPGEKISVSIDANTALCIRNPSADNVSVKLKVTGDTGLSMDYKN